MAEYINRIAAIRAIIAREFHDCGDCERAKEGSGDDYCFNEGLLSAVDAVQDIPAADVAPVVHAHWTDKRLVSMFGGGYDVARCSRCKFEYMLYDTHYHPDYCCKCGAKMDESEDGK